MHYLDNASTTRPYPEVVAEVERMLTGCWANPSALYRAGMEAEETVEQARRAVCAALGVPYTDPRHREVFFTAGGTEANNISLLGAARVRKSWGDQLVATGYEHSSVLKPLQLLAQREGFTLTLVGPGPDGLVDTAALAAAVGPKTALVAAMQVNNETGALLDVARLAAMVKAKNPRTFVHVDGVQAFCKLPLGLAATRIDGYAVSGHKLHAPKGVGALYLRGGQNVLPPMAGGGQEADGQNRSIRPGTENTAYIAGFAQAVRLAAQAMPEAQAHMAALRGQLLQGLAQLPDITLHSPQGGFPGIVFFSMPAGYKSQVMLNYLDAQHDVQLSAGSACDKGEPSHTLQAMGLPPQLTGTALRASFSSDTTPADVDALLAGLRGALNGEVARAG